MDEGPTYEEITQRLQIMVHNLTDNGIPISAEDESFLNSIPELAPEFRPVVDENSKFPEYFEEFLLPGKQNKKYYNRKIYRKGSDSGPFFIICGIKLS